MVAVAVRVELVVTVAGLSATVAVGAASVRVIVAVAVLESTGPVLVALYVKDVFPVVSVTGLL